jgi:diacylglycerol kinase family enzyme
MAKYCVVYNKRAGFLSSERLLHDLFEANKLDAEFIKCSSSVDRRIDGAVKKGSRIIVAVGGDGTVNTVAAHVAGTNLAMAVVPIGTYNHFAKDLNIPLEADKAIALIARGKARKIDTATVNGRLFVNLSSIGLYPRLIHARSRTLFLGKRLSNILGAIQSVSWPLLHDIDVSVDGKNFSRRTSLVVVSNNSYEITKTGFANRLRLDGGWLWLYIVKSQRPWQLLRVGWRSWRGNTDAELDFEEYTAKNVRITSPGRHKMITVALDGEVVHFRSPLIYAINSKSLKVLVP